MNQPNRLTAYAGGRAFHADIASTQDGRYCARSWYLTAGRVLRAAGAAGSQVRVALEKGTGNTPAEALAALHAKLSAALEFGGKRALSEFRCAES